MKRQALYTMNFSGNVHQASQAINGLGLAERLLQISSDGYNSVAVFRMTTDEVRKERKSCPFYVGDNADLDKLDARDRSEQDETQGKTQH